MFNEEDDAAENTFEHVAAHESGCLVLYAMGAPFCL